MGTSGVSMRIMVCVFAQDLVGAMVDDSFLRYMTFAKYTYPHVSGMHTPHQPFCFLCFVAPPSTCHHKQTAHAHCYHTLVNCCMQRFCMLFMRVGRVGDALLLHNHIDTPSGQLGHVRPQMEAALQTPLRAQDIESSIFQATGECVSWIDKSMDAFSEKRYTYSVVVRS